MTSKNLRRKINKLLQEVYYDGKFDPTFEPGIVDEILSLIKKAKPDSFKRGYTKGVLDSEYGQATSEEINET